MAIWLCTVDTSSVHVYKTLHVLMLKQFVKRFSIPISAIQMDIHLQYIYIYILPLNWFFGNVNIRSLIQPY